MENFKQRYLTENLRRKERKKERLFGDTKINQGEKLRVKFMVKMECNDQFSHFDLGTLL